MDILAITAAGPKPGISRCCDTPSLERWLTKKTKRRPLSVAVLPSGAVHRLKAGLIYRTGIGHVNWISHRILKKDAQQVAFATEICNGAINAYVTAQLEYCVNCACTSSRA